MPKEVETGTTILRQLKSGRGKSIFLKDGEQVEVEGHLARHLKERGGALRLLPKSPRGERPVRGGKLNALFS